MGAIVLVAAFILEAAFAAYCITTKSYQRPLRSWIRISALILFVLLTVAAVIQWGDAVVSAGPAAACLLNILSDALVRLIDAVPNAQEAVAVKHLAATSPHAYEVDLPGTDHMSLTDLPLISPFLVALINSAVPKAGGDEADPYGALEKMNRLVVNFFDAYVKGEGEFVAP